MAVDDDMSEASVSSLILSSLESKQTRDVLSPEDLAWVESCLIKDSEILDSDWNSLKDVLLDILNSQPDSLDFSASSAAGSDDLPRNDIEILASSVVPESAQFPGRLDNDLVPIYEEMENDNHDVPKNKKTNNWLSQNFYRNAFLPNYNEDLKGSESTDIGLDLGLSGHEMEPSIDDIFKVWDLNVPNEEDKLVKQLNEALAESSFQLIPSFDNSRAWKDLKDESVDDLIVGIADLSLSRSSL